MESSAFNEWKGVGGYAEVFSKYPSYFLHPLFKLRPRKTSLSAVSNYATQFGQSTQCLPSPIWVFALIVLKAKLRVISRFVRLANMNLNPLITQERDFDAFPLPHRRRRPMTSRCPQASLRVGVLERERLAALVKSLMPAQRQCALPALASRWNWRWLRLPHQLASSRAYRATFARSCFSQPSSSLFGLL